MLAYDELIIRKFIYHPFEKDAEEILASDLEIEIRNDDEALAFQNILLKPFTQVAETHDFFHPINLKLNTLKSIIDGYQQDSESFVEKSQEIMSHLHSVSKHPNIKSGDVFMLGLEDLRFKSKHVDGFAIVKVENKANFIETQPGSGEINLKKGIGNQKLDKGCLVLFTEDEPTILLVEQQQKETDYWKNEFVKVALKNDEINSTNQFMGMTKQFITQQIPHEYEVDKTDQIDLLNKSAAYFKSNESFNKQEFETEVLQDPEMIKSFRSYDTAFREEKDIAPFDEFEISKKAVQKQAKVFKSVLKLDKNFHIYIHGDKSLISKGTDDNGRKFYKIYYEEEQ